MAVVRVEDSSRYGTVQVDGNQKVIGFVEKAGSNGPGLVNAGVYVFDPRVFEYIPHGRRVWRRMSFRVSSAKAFTRWSTAECSSTSVLRKITQERNIFAIACITRPYPNLFECNARKGVNVP